MSAPTQQLILPEGMPYPASSIAPTSLTNLIGWYDANVFASLTLSGSNCTAIADQSGFGSGVALGSFGGTVTYSATSFNGKPGLTFSSGNSAVLEGHPFPMGTGSTMTAWAVCKMTGASTSSGRILSYAKTISSEDFDNIGSFAVGSGSTPNNVDFNRNNVHSTNGTLAASTNYRFIFTVDSSGNMTTFVNGVPATSGVSNGAWGDGGYFDLGRQAARADNFWFGTLAEAGVARGFSDYATVLGLDLYLKNKWGL